MTAEWTNEYSLILVRLPEFTCNSTLCKFNVPLNIYVLTTKVINSLLMVIDAYIVKWHGSVHDVLSLQCGQIIIQKTKTNA